MNTFVYVTENNEEINVGLLVGQYVRTGGLALLLVDASNPDIILLNVTADVEMFGDPNVVCLNTEGNPALERFIVGNNIGWNMSQYSVDGYRSYPVYKLNTNLLNACAIHTTQLI